MKGVGLYELNAMEIYINIIYTSTIEIALNLE